MSDRTEVRGDSVLVDIVAAFLRRLIGEREVFTAKELQEAHDETDSIRVDGDGDNVVVRLAKKNEKHSGTQ